MRELFEKMRILVGVDGSKHADKALKEAVIIAKKFSGFVKVLTVYGKSMDTKAEEITDAAKQFCLREMAECFEVSSLLGSNPARALQDTAKNEKFDLIVVGSRGLGSTASILLGSVSRQVAANAECNVLVVKK